MLFVFRLLASLWAIVKAMCYFNLLIGFFSSAGGTVETVKE